MIFPFRRAKERKITKRKGECDSELQERENDGSTSPISAISGTKSAGTVFLYELNYQLLIGLTN